MKMSIDVHIKNANDALDEGSSKFFDCVLKAIEDASSICELHKVMEESKKRIKTPIPYNVEVANAFIEKATKKTETLSEMYYLYCYILFNLPCDGDKEAKNMIVEKINLTVKNWDEAYEAYHRTGHKIEFIYRMVEFTETEKQAWCTRLIARSSSYDDLKKLAEEKCNKFPCLEKHYKDTKATILPIRAR